MSPLSDTTTYEDSGIQLPWRLSDEDPSEPVQRPWPFDTSTWQIDLPSEPLQLSPGISQALAEALRSRVEFGTLCRTFVEALREISEVKKVLLLRQADTALVTTLIDARPFDRKVRDKVYAAQRSVLVQSQDLAIEFRLINLRELQEELAYVVPSDAVVLYPVA